MALIVLGELLPETALSSYRAYPNQKKGVCLLCLCNPSANYSATEIFRFHLLPFHKV